MPPKAIIFDIGRVIVRVNLNRLLEPLASLMPPRSGLESSKKLSPQQIWQAIESDPHWQDWQEGRMSPEQWCDHLTGRLGVRMGFADFRNAWNRALDPDLILDDSLFETLGKRYKLALLSNTDPLHSAHMESHFPFVRHFPVRIYSWRIGAAKPSATIYRTGLDSLNVAPAEALYIDDIAEFAAAARGLGMDSIQFASPAQLLEEFSRRGL